MVALSAFQVGAAVAAAPVALVGGVVSPSPAAGLGGHGATDRRDGRREVPRANSALFRHFPALADTLAWRRSVWSARRRFTALRRRRRRGGTWSSWLRERTS